jgi:hypothetical protein
MEEANLTKIFEAFGDPSEAWISRCAYNEKFEKAVEWLYNAKDWSTILHLTFRDDVTESFATKTFKGLIRQLNRETFGNHYTRIVKHSYFSYVHMLERQIRGAIHIHALMDRRVHQTQIRDLWFLWVGIAEVQTIRNKMAAVKYVLKGIKTGADLEIPFLSKIKADPPILPVWWKQ